MFQLSVKLCRGQEPRANLLQKNLNLHIGDGLKKLYNELETNIAYCISHTRNTL